MKIYMTLLTGYVYIIYSIGIIAPAPSAGILLAMVDHWRGQQDEEQ